MPDWASSTLLISLRPLCPITSLPVLHESKHKHVWSLSLLSTGSHTTHICEQYGYVLAAVVMRKISSGITAGTSSLRSASREWLGVRKEGRETGG